MKTTLCVVFTAIALVATMLVGNTSAEARSKNVAISQLEGKTDNHDREIVAVKWAIKACEDEIHRLKTVGTDKARKEAAALNYELIGIRTSLSKMERRVKLDKQALSRLNNIVTQYGEAIAELQKGQMELQDTKADRSELVTVTRQTNAALSGIWTGVKAVNGKVEEVDKKKQDRLYHELVVAGFADIKDFGPAIGYNLLIPASDGWAVGFGPGFGYASNAGGPAFLVRLFGQKQLAEWFALRFGAAGALETKASNGQVRGSSVNLTIGPVFSSGHFVAGLDAGAGVERSADGPQVPIAGSGLTQRQTQNAPTFLTHVYLGVRF